MLKREALTSHHFLIASQPQQVLSTLYCHLILATASFTRIYATHPGWMKQVLIKSSTPSVHFIARLSSSAFILTSIILRLISPTAAQIRTPPFASDFWFVNSLSSPIHSPFYF